LPTRDGIRKAFKNTSELGEGGIETSTENSEKEKKKLDVIKEKKKAQRARKQETDGRKRGHRSSRFGALRARLSGNQVSWRKGKKR